MQRAQEVAAADPYTMIFKLKEPFAPFIMGWEPSIVGEGLNDALPRLSREGR